MIPIGNTIPDVTCEACLPDGRIEPLALAHSRGKWRVLFFRPLDFTFGGPPQIRAYSNLSHDFDMSGAVLLGDVPRKLAQGFGVIDDNSVAARTPFLLNPEGQAMSIAANALNVGRSAQETLRLLHALHSGELTACERQPGQSFAAAA